MPRPEGQPAEPRETELKFALDAATLAKLRGAPALTRLRRAKRLRSVYFDTPDHRLWAAGFCLRVREAGGRFEQTVKRRSHGSGFERGEWSEAIASDRPELAALAKTPAARVAAHQFADLGPVFVTTVERRSRLVKDGESTVEVSIDQGDVSAAGHTAPICELELELKAGRREAVFELARALRERAPLRMGFESKAGRGYRLAEGAELAAVKAGPSPVEAGMTAGEAFGAVGNACLAQVAQNADLLQRVRRPETLHQMRVGLRRFRAALKTFAPMLAPADNDRMKAESKWLAKELDGARDLDVFIRDAFRPAALEVDRDRGFATFGKALARAQGAAYDRAVNAGSSERFAAFLLETSAWLEVGLQGMWDDPTLKATADQPVKGFAAQSLDRLRKQVCKKGKGFSQLDAASRHKLRIEVKNLRYTVEFFSPLFSGKAQARFLGRLEDIQERLGGLNDIAVGRDIAASVLGKDDAHAALAAGRAIGRREAFQPRLIDEADHALKRFKDAPKFWR
jgi:triphosphatase